MPRLLHIAGGGVIVSGLALVAVVSPPTASAKTVSPSSSPSSFSLVGDPSFGKAVSFAANFSIGKNVPEESVACTQNGQNVYLNVQTGPVGSTVWNTQFMLFSQAWSNNGGGPADCAAQLFYYTWSGHSETGVVVLGSSSFTTT